MFGLLGPRRVRLEQQIETLADFGLCLSEGVSFDHVLAACPRADAEAAPYLRLLAAYAGKGSRQPFGALSGDVVILEEFGIDATGDYARIADRIGGVMGGDCPMRNIRDFVAPITGRAWLEFEADGETLHWKAAIRGTRVDGAMIGRLISFLEEHLIARRFVTLALSEGRRLLFCCDASRLDELRQATRLDFAWFLDTVVPAPETGRDGASLAA